MRFLFFQFIGIDQKITEWQNKQFRHRVFELVLGWHHFVHFDDHTGSVKLE